MTPSRRQGRWAGGSPQGQVPLHPAKEMIDPNPTTKVTTQR